MPFTQNRRVTRPFCARALQQANRMTLDAAPSLAPSRQPALCWRYFQHFRHFQACAPLLARSMLQASQSSWLIHRENAVTALKEEAIPTGRLAPIDEGGLGGSVVIIGIIGFMLDWMCERAIRRASWAREE